MRKNATVFDVAELAGVSRGTVDRVIKKRGRVSEEATRRVQEAIDKLHYVPNASASCLATKKLTKLAYLIPSHEKGDYWQLIDLGFQMGLESLSQYNIELKAFYYDPNSSESFCNAYPQVLEYNPDGVITNAAPKKPLMDFAEKLGKRSIPMAFIDNKHDDANYLMYYGVDPYKSGALGAFLLTMRQDVSSIAMIRIKNSNNGLHDYIAPRSFGVLDYLTNNFPNSTIYTVFIDGTAGKSNWETLNAFFKEHPQIKHIIFTNSRVHLIADWLRSNPDPERIVVGYDDLDRNLKALEEGLVEFLVTRKVPDQSKNMLIEFAQCIILGTAPVKKNNYVHMDILHRHNMDDYR